MTLTRSFTATYHCLVFPREQVGWPAPQRVHKEDGREHKPTVEVGDGDRAAVRVDARLYSHQAIRWLHGDDGDRGSVTVMASHGGVISSHRRSDCQSRLAAGSTTGGIGTAPALTPAPSAWAALVVAAPKPLLVSPAAPVARVGAVVRVATVRRGSRTPTPTGFATVRTSARTADDQVDEDSDSVPDECEFACGNDNTDSDGDGVPNGCDVCAGSDSDSDSDARWCPGGLRHVRGKR